MNYLVLYESFKSKIISSEFSNFDDDFDLIDESILYFTPNMRKLLASIEYTSSGNIKNICKDLEDLEGTNLKDDITFVDVDDQGFVSFLKMKDVLKKVPDDIKYLADRNVGSSIINTLWDLVIDKPEITKSKNKLKFGRFIKKVLKDKYSDKDLEQISTTYKFHTDKDDFNGFELVEGDDIGHWYNYANYNSDNGSLGSSCMRGKSSYILNLYIQNPDTCKLLIVKNSIDKLIARALVWKVSDQPFEFFMDRQYCESDFLVNKMRAYADKMGWAYREINSYHNGDQIVYGGKSLNRVMTVIVKKEPYRYYPYLDTFKIYNPSTGILTNDTEKGNYEGCYWLESTGGGYDEIQTGNYSEYYDEVIPEDESVWSDFLDDYLYADRSVYVRHGSRRFRGYYPDDYDDIVYSEKQDIHIHRDDSYYSEHYSDYLYDDGYLLNAIYELEFESIDVSGKTIYVPKIAYLNKSWVLHNDDDFISINDIINFDDYGFNDSSISLIHKKYVDQKSIWLETTYKVLEQDLYLNERDAEILGVDIDKEDSIKMDLYDYLRKLELNDLRKSILEKIESEGLTEKYKDREITLSKEI